MAMYLLLIPPRRPKTLIIYNNEDLCSSKLPSSVTNNHTSVVIVVLSSRETYGSIKLLNNVHILAVVFMIGSLDALDVPKVDTDELEMERAQYGDLIMGDFVDTYQNLTRKSIMSYNWVTTYCNAADILVKTDDDVMLNIFKLTEELGKWPHNLPNNIWCAVHFIEELNRTESSRYYVSPEEYRNDTAPPHCGGVGYVTPMAVVRKIDDEISRSFLGAVCPQEDIFMTGIVPERINLGDSGRIELIDKMVDWIMYILEHNGNYADILKLIEQPTSEPIDFVEFRRLFGTRLFFLVDHGSEFERVYRRVWHIVENSYRDERGELK